MSLILIAPNRDVQSLKEAMHKIDANLEIEIWPDISNKDSVQFAVVWRHPAHILQKFLNLKAVSALGAGVDHILNDESLPQDVTICRVVSKDLVDQMKTYLLNAVLNYQRNMYTYFEQQKKGIWNPVPNKVRTAFTVGVMGLGKIGLPVAKQFVEMGYKTTGWSKSKKQVEGLETFSGEANLDIFLNKTKVLICLLPLTCETKGILNLDIFKQLEQPGYLINVGRGEHLVEEDLIYALDKEWLAGTTLDVFSEEPLPEQHPFWNRDNIIITPHISSISQPEGIASQIIENYKRSLSGLPLKNRVDPKKGY